jgi:uncharacterized membrane protein
MKPDRLSAQLRLDRSPALRRRRAIVGLSLGAAGVMGLITLYQTGLLSRLPDLPLRRFDARKVNGSAQAYDRLDTPDAALGLASYATTLVLAAMGGRGRARRQPWIPLLLMAKVVLDALEAARLTRDQWTKHRAFCAWCLAAAAATFATVPLAVPEARAAWATLTARLHDAERTHRRRARRRHRSRSPHDASVDRGTPTDSYADSAAEAIHDAFLGL